ncbi:MAG: serine/threonine-protein kinase M1 [Chrysothrix sp. TS-e1954]|nr:MAG: serine/threonine-protein kinase M1 [Chrysothrix sp. TS-e1954]
MARRSGTIHANASVVGTAHDGAHVHAAQDDSALAPPSTLAAQIVNNHIDGPQQHAKSKATFGQLLNEIRACPDNVEADTQTNVQLIKVVAEAGFNPLSRDDPFAKHGEIVSQAIACLDVIRIVIDRDPDVIFHAPDDDTEDVPLAFWLIPKLLTIVDCSKDELQDSVRSLLGFMPGLLHRMPSFWQEHALLMSVLRACANDVVTMTEARPKHKRDTSSDVLLPSAESRSSLLANEHQPIVLQCANHVKLRNLSHVVAIVTSIVNNMVGLSPVSSEDREPVDGDMSAIAFGWVTRILFRVEILLQVEISTSLSPNEMATSMTILRSFTNCAFYVLQSQATTSSWNRIHTLFSKCLVNLCSRLRTVSGLLEGHEIDLAKAFVAAAQFASVAPQGKNHLSRHLSSFISTILQDLKKTDQPSQDLLCVVQLLALTLKLPAHKAGTQSSTNPAEIMPLIVDVTIKSAARRITFQGEINREWASPRPLKRQKVDDPNLRELHNHYKGAYTIQGFSQLFDVDDDGRLNDLSEVISAAFESLAIDDQAKALLYLSRLPCRNLKVSPSKSTPTHPPTRCRECRSSGLPYTGVRLSTLDEEQWNKLFGCLVQLLDTSAIQASKRLQVLALMALQSMISHTPVAGHLDLVSASCGQWCLQKLKSSSREVRLAAICTLPCFLAKDNSFDEKLCRRNRVLVLDFLRQVAESAETRMCEMLIFAFGEVARVCGDAELHLVLLQLVNFLGHQNSLVCALANAELKGLALSVSTSAEELFRPYWQTVAVVAIKDFPGKPQKVQQLCDILSITIDEFLVKTQAETVPHLISGKRIDVLERISSARGSKSTVWKVCTQSRNLAATLALLFGQQPHSAELLMQESFKQLNENLEPEDIQSLLKSEPILVACNLLKLAGEAADHERAQAVEGLKEFAILSERRGHSRRTSASQARVLSAFFDNHALGIMASFSNTVENASQPISEKRRSINAIREMVDVAGSDIAFTLPQISACLQSALDEEQLCNDAFAAWLKIFEALNVEQDVGEGIISLTFTAIVQHWHQLSPDLQQATHSTVASLFKDHGHMMQDVVELLPSLKNIPLMSKFETQLERLKSQLNEARRFSSFSRRCKDENSRVVLQGLRELLPYLRAEQVWIHTSAASEQPDPVVADLVRSLLDACAKFSNDSKGIADLSAQCLGIIGCLDPNSVETVREKQDMVVLSNFSIASEAVDFVTFMLQQVIVKAFHSVSNPRAQGFLAYVMQELLRFCGFTKEFAQVYRPHNDSTDEAYQRFASLPELVKSTLTPFLSSHYVVNTQHAKRPWKLGERLPPPTASHSIWLREITFGLLHTAKGENASMIFSVLARIIRQYDVSIADTLLPFAAANVMLGGSDTEISSIMDNLLSVLQHPTEGLSQSEAANLKLCSESVFRVLDYLSLWLQEKAKQLTGARNLAAKSGKKMPPTEEAADEAQIKLVERTLAFVPADVISRRAVECGSYARALLHWENHIRHQRQAAQQPGGLQIDEDSMYQRLQDIYTRIDDPDGIEGVSSHLSILSPEQQVMEHRRAGRWAAAQSWYEIELEAQPDNPEINANLLSCLKEAGQNASVVRRASALDSMGTMTPKAVTAVAQAAWCTDRWDVLERLTVRKGDALVTSFDAGIGEALVALHRNDNEAFDATLQDLRQGISKTLTASMTSSIQTCHDALLKLHSVYELEVISDNAFPRPPAHEGLEQLLSGRLDIMGSYLSEKQHLLSIRRAAMTARSAEPFRAALPQSWMTTAKLARKGNKPALAYDAVWHASQLRDDSSKLEQARLLWDAGEQRKAIQSLEGVIQTKSYISGNEESLGSNNAASAAASMTESNQNQQNLLAARAHLLLAKWLDRAGQSQSSIIQAQYQQAVKCFGRWEKGSYYLGRFYNKLLESEKVLPLSQQSNQYLSGETARLVIENYLRSMQYGCKYLFETLPKLLTLWLDFGIEITRNVSKEVPDDVRNLSIERRPKMLELMNKAIKKYADRIATYLFYTALPQMITRISHPNQKVWELLCALIVKTAAAHPQQALWPLLAVVKSTSHERASRGLNILNKIKDRSKSVRHENNSLELRALIAQGQKLSDALLRACEAPIDGRTATVSLSRDLGFNHKVAPCALVVPLERTLFASLPTTAPHPTHLNQSASSSSTTAANVHIPNLRAHKAFPMSRDALTISSFSDEVLVLPSLQRPRKISLRASDGTRYALLCKPNDDLRKDQRLMEFNAMINRSLKKHAPASARRLYVRTYAVTPLNEACGLIEWVDGLKPLRDILLALYRAKGIKVDYALLRDLLNEVAAAPENARIFPDVILPMYPPLLHEWFVSSFPDPSAWLAARTRYTRSCAVASIVGHALGLGDRHGENVLLEQHSGGVFHVDFNCLFDKGLTFEKPELVPFRLTHNMVDAMGPTGTAGSFLKSCQLTLAVMRSVEASLLTILETFVYDPTADFVANAGRKRRVKGVPETPKEVLEGVRGKIRGFLRGESVGLGVEGYVDVLVGQARDGGRLGRMYIGWCAFL